LTRILSNAFWKEKSAAFNLDLKLIFLLNNIPLKFGGWDGSGWVMKMGKRRHFIPSSRG
jgi:hypothetical protein